MNTSRRCFLAGTVGAVGLFAGCIANTEERTTGESVSAGGLVASVEDFLTAPELLDVDIDEPILPPEGAVYLLIHVVFENDADVQRELPSSSEAELMYNDEEAPLADVGYEDTVVYQGTKYSVYRYNYGDVDAVFPGKSFEGWLIYTVPENFQPSEAVLEIEVETEEDDVTGEWTLG